MERYYLYRITNTVNGKIYIGQTKRPKYRWSDHKSDARTRSEKHKMPLHRAIKKYGNDKFVFEFIASCNGIDNADYIERQLIKQYNSLVINGLGYNVSSGGNIANKPPNRKFSDSEETYFCILYNNGTTIANIAKEYGARHNLVYRILVRHNINIRSHYVEYTKEIRDKMSINKNKTWTIENGKRVWKNKE